MLFRLFHELNCRVFEPKPLKYQCSCSRERCESTLASLGEAELKDILKERGNIEINCQFCGAQYDFNEADIDKILRQKPVVH